MLTVANEDSAVLDAVLAGASGYLLKDATLADIVRGIRAAAAGHSLIAPSVAGNLLAQLRRRGPPDAAPHGRIRPLGARARRAAARRRRL